MNNKLKVEIWSDVVCPFCYIGKREFEKALEQFPQKDRLDIEWKSYQLAPELETQPGKNINDYLVEAKGISLKDAEQMNASIAERGKGLGLEYNFQNAIPANTMKAHNFAHFAKKYGKQDEAEEVLFRSYFTEGKNIDDTDVLLKLGEELGLDTEQLKPALENLEFENDVRADIYDAFQLGVRGVPFFVFDRKYGVSGAQPHQAFLETLEKSFSEWEGLQPTPLKVQRGESCDIDGNCN